MKKALSLVLALLLATSGQLSAQEKPDTKPARPPQADPALPGGLPGQPPLVGGGGIGGPPGFQQTDYKELVAALIEVLDDADADVRQEVAAALGKVGRQAVSPLLGILKDKEKSAAARANAAFALGHVGPQAQEAIPELTKALKEKDKDLRKRAAFALGNIVQGGGFGFGFPGGPIGPGRPIGPGGGPGGIGIKPIEPGAVPPPPAAPPKEKE
jgi:hypothetical protein